MKTGIFVTVAALGLALFAVPDAPAQAWWGHHYNPKTLHLRLSGSNFVTSSQDDGTPTPADGQVLTAMQSGIAKGKLGRALFTSQAVLEEVSDDPNDFPPECLAMGMGGAGVSVTIVFTYNDGSILSVVSGPGTFFCASATDPPVFIVDVVEGTVTGGEGRFAGATGTFDGTARSVSSRVTAEITVDLD